MRFDGTLTTWSEAKGFGFLTPRQGGQDVFVHIKAFPRGSGSPRVGDAFSFEVEQNPEGKKRAVQLRPLGPAGSAGAARPAAARSRAVAPPRKTGGFLPLAMLVVAVLAAAAYWYSRQGGLPTAPAEEALPVRLAPAPVRTAQEPAQPPQPAFRCDGRTHCSQMTSCAEATFFSASCPGTRMDGNNDGVPCEMQWCTGPGAR